MTAATPHEMAVTSAQALYRSLTYSVVSQWMDSYAMTLFP